MADLVISDTDLGALHAAQAEFSEARTQDIWTLGTTASELADKVDRVRSVMKTIDLQLGDQASRAI